MVKAVFVSVVFLLQMAAFAALPLVNSYNHFDYHGGAENWDIIQAPNQFIYVANEKGVLQYDGKTWVIIRTPQKTRSLVLVDDSLLYVGCDNDFGYINIRDEKNKKFHSLKPLLAKAGIDFLDEVWELLLFEGKLVLQTPSRLITIKNRKIEAFDVSCFVRATFLVDDKLYVVDQRKGLLLFKDDALTPLVHGDFVLGDEVNSILSFSNGDLLVSLYRKGIHVYDGTNFRKWYNDSDEKIRKAYVFSSAKKEGKFYFGTTENGVYVLSESGDLLSHLNEHSGLVSNKVFNLFVDEQQSIWVAHENGIEHIAMNAPISKINAQLGLNGICYAANIFDNRLFVSTSQGVFQSSVPILNVFSGEKNQMNIYSGIIGPVHFFKKWGNEYLYGHLSGLYLGKDKFRLLAEGRNCFDVYALSANYLLVAYEDKMQLVKVDYGKTSSIFDFTDLKGVESIHHTISGLWLNTRFEGILRLMVDTLNPDKYVVEKMGSKQGLPKDAHHRIFSIANTIFCATDVGIYEYNLTNAKFEKSARFSELSDMVVDYLYEDRRGNSWFQAGKYNKNGYVDYFCGVQTTEGEIQTKIKGEHFEFISQLNDSLMAFGTYEGLKIINLHKRRDSYTSKVFFYDILLLSGTRDAQLKFDFGSKCFWRNGEKIQPDQIPAEYNRVVFKFGNTLLHDSDKNEYRFKLEGFDDEWTQWEHTDEKIYPFLKSGEYVFRLEGQNAFGVESEELDFKFTVGDPFYSSSWLYVFGVIFFIATIVIVFVWVSRPKSGRA